MPALLGGPAVHPVAPRGVAAEQGRDLVVVAGQVVLGQQVDDQRGPRHVGHLRVLDRPGVAVERAVEVAAVAPRDVLVGEPLLGHREVPVEVLLDDRLELEQQLGLVLSGALIGVSLVDGLRRTTYATVRLRAERPSPETASSSTRLPCPSAVWNRR